MIMVKSALSQRNQGNAAPGVTISPLITSLTPPDSHSTTVIAACEIPNITAMNPPYLPSKGPSNQRRACIGQTVQVWIITFHGTHKRHVPLGQLSA
jgi:hypothetical protein